LEASVDDDDDDDDDDVDVPVPTVPPPNPPTEMKKGVDYELDYPPVLGGILPTVSTSELLEADRSDFYEGAIIYVRYQKARVERSDWPLIFYRIFNPHFREDQSREMCIPMVEDGVKYILGPEKHRHFGYTKHIFTVDASSRERNIQRKRQILGGTPDSDDYSEENDSGPPRMWSTFGQSFPPF